MMEEEKVKVPEQIKKDNWAFYVLARSDSPVIKCLNTKNLVTNLIATMKIGEIIEFDSLLSRANTRANRAWYEYTALKNDGLAVQSANASLEIITFLIYDKRFATPESDSFKGRGV